MTVRDYRQLVAAALTSRAKTAAYHAEQARLRALLPPISPWGTIDHSSEIANGIYQVSTPSHGGIWLIPERLRLVPDYFKAATFMGQGWSGWFEEDADWAFVAVAFPQLAQWQHPSRYKGQCWLEFAMDVLRNWHPEAYEAHFQEPLLVEQSYTLRERAKYTARGEAIPQWLAPKRFPKPQVA